MAPVPEQASGITSWRVWNSILRPALTSAKSAWYSGVRWWMIGRAMASRTSLGTGVGPGAMSWYFFIEFRPSRLDADLTTPLALPAPAPIVSCRPRASAHGMPERGDEQGIAARCVGSKEVDDVSVVVREAAGAEAERVRGEIRAATTQAGVEVDEAVAAVAEGGQDLVQTRQKVDDGGGITPQRLFQTEVGGLLTEHASPDQLEAMGVGPVQIGAGQ